MGFQAATEFKERRVSGRLGEERRSRSLSLLSPSRGIQAADFLMLAL